MRREIGIEILLSFYGFGVTAERTRKLSEGRKTVSRAEHNAIFSLRMIPIAT